MFNSGYYNSLPYLIGKNLFLSPQQTNSRLDQTVQGNEDDGLIALHSSVQSIWNEFKNHFSNIIDQLLPFNFPKIPMEMNRHIPNQTSRIRINWKKRIDYNDGSFYIGNYDQFRRRVGPGITIYRDGGYYLGQYVADYKHGYGKRVYGDGTQYEGEFFCSRLVPAENSKDPANRLLC